MSLDATTFCELAKRYDAVPVAREVRGDLDLATPLALFWKIKRGPWSFLLESVEGGERWARFTAMGTEPWLVFRACGSQLEVIHAEGPTELIETSSPLEEILQRFDPERVFHDSELPRFHAGLVGALGYDAVKNMERLPDRHASADDPPELVFMVPRVTLVRDNLTHRATLIALAMTPDGCDASAAWEEAQRVLDQAQARLAEPLPAMPRATPSEPRDPAPSMSDADFCAAVESARDYIEAGDAIQVVLSRRFRQEANGLHPFLVYRTLRALNPSPYMLYLELGETTLVGASPEVLVRVTDGCVETRPIAGTRPRGATPEADDALATELLADPKERAEHVMLVDLGRNDLGRICEVGSVAVTESMTIERYSHVMHIVSHVTGTLRTDIGPADVIRAVFPAGTLSGAPKIRAMEIIDELETSRRGFYGGAVGMLGTGGNLDLCITIRTLEARTGTFDVQAGAGIVFDSLAQSEADETRAKARSALRAVDEARERFGDAS
jgi:anthranilate synthase component 1